MTNSSIYLDYAATTPVDPRVLEAMLPFWQAEFGNASSVYSRGRRVRKVIEECRSQIAGYLGAQPSEIYFTSGGTESNNTVIRGNPLDRLVTSTIEHKAVLSPAKGAVVLQPSWEGLVHSADLANQLLGRSPALVSTMWVNNEIGSVNPVKELSVETHRHGGLFHSDAVQAYGYYKTHVDDLGVDALSISGHKIYGPKGISLLYLRNSEHMWKSLISGGSQESGFRGGTENVAMIVGLAKAMELAELERDTRYEHSLKLKTKFAELLRQSLGEDVVINGPAVESGAPHILNVSLLREGEPIESQMTIAQLDRMGIEVSDGSACNSGVFGPSHVLEGIGLEPRLAESAIRFSFGTGVDMGDLGRVVDALLKMHAFT